MNILVPAAAVAVVAAFFLTRPQGARPGHADALAARLNTLPQVGGKGPSTAVSQVGGKGPSTAVAQVAPGASSKDSATGGTPATALQIPRPTTQREAMAQLQVGLREYALIWRARSPSRVGMSVPTGITPDGVFGPVTARYLVYFVSTIPTRTDLMQAASGRVGPAETRAVASFLAPCSTSADCPSETGLVAAARTASSILNNVNSLGEMAHMVIRITQEVSRRSP
jgi:hypothetical protein